MKAVSYIRCSTSEQDTANQRLALEQWAERRGFEVVATYQENESAWRQGHQRELARLLNDAPKGRFDLVLVWSLDRLSRLGAAAILNLIHRLGKSGVRVFSFQESWTESPSELTELLFSVIGWTAKMESRRYSERTKAGLARARAQVPGGKLPTRGPDKKKRKRRRPRPSAWESV